MYQGDDNCSRHPQNTLSFCCPTRYSVRFFCQQCIEENLNHQQQVFSKEQFQIKLENEIYYWKKQMSFQGQLKQKNKNFRHFKRLINKLCEQIINLNESTMEQESFIIKDEKLNQMEQFLKKLKAGNLKDLNNYHLIFSEDKDGIIMRDFSKFKEDIKIISQDINQANEILEQILNHNNQEKQEIKEHIFYKNCKKMFEENKYETYQFVEESFRSNPEDIKQNITSWIKQYSESNQRGSQLEIEEEMKRIVISIYILCRDMKYNLEVEDLFEILSAHFGYDVATNILEDILEYK